VELIRRLDQAGVEVTDVGLRRPTLDDVFMRLTGHVAEETPDETSEESNDESPDGTGDEEKVEATR
jgi:ABC-2 type transport system ATP-binding protein